MVLSESGKVVGEPVDTDSSRYTDAGVETANSTSTAKLVKV